MTADEGGASAAGDDVRSLSFEQAMNELELIVERLERGDVSLEESIDIYRRGNLLRAYCDEKLASARARIEKITEDGGSSEPFDAS